LTAKYFYDICCPYTDGYFRSLLYDFSQILVASEVFTHTKMTKNAVLKKICGEFFCFLGNMLIGVYTTYIQKINNFRLLLCSPAYCLKGK